MFCPSGEWPKVQRATSRLAKYRKLGGSELQKCTVNRKGISFTRRQQPMNRITLPLRTIRGSRMGYRPVSRCDLTDGRSWNLLRSAPLGKKEVQEKLRSSMARRSKTSPGSPRSRGTSIRTERRRAMQDNSANSRDFNSMSVAGLSDEARQAVNTAFGAMSAWRIDIANSNEKNSEQVIEKMAAAARALGWPEQIVDATRAQLQSITKLQIQMMDHMMDIWEEQIKSPNPMIAPSAMLSKLKSLPGPPAGTWPNADTFAGTAMNPMQFGVQWAEQFQKAWADAVGVGIGGQRRR